VNNDSSIVLEMDISTVGRLLEAKVVSLEEIHGVNSRSKRRLHRLLLEVLKRELTYVGDSNNKKVKGDRLVHSAI
jgi:hypothetical protein